MADKLSMSGNSFGKLFKISTFGESHGPFVGLVIDGCPAGLKLDVEAIQTQLARRRPGQSKISTQRKELDQVEFFSGIFEGVTTGTPIMAGVFNQDARSKDYKHLKDVFRPSHADYTFFKKYGYRDHHGGGRSSARETLARVIGGAIAQQILMESHSINIRAAVTQIAGHKLSGDSQQWDWSSLEETPVRCPDLSLAKKMQALIEEARNDGDSLGGVVYCEVTGCPAGLGEPVFDKLHADLAKAMISINASRGFEIGKGFSSVELRGSEHNDPFLIESGQVKTETNNSGGIQGGISNGMPIYFNVAFKPVATIMKEQNTLNIDSEETQVKGHGRHDPCVVPRAVPIVESMAALVVLDHLLRSKTSRMDQING